MHMCRIARQRKQRGACANEQLTRLDYGLDPIQIFSFKECRGAIRDMRIRKADYLQMILIGFGWRRVNDEFLKQNACGRSHAAYDTETESMTHGDIPVPARSPMQV